MPYRIFLTLLIPLLAACGSESPNSFTANIFDKSYSCPSREAMLACSSSSCPGCTCTAGCDGTTSASTATPTTKARLSASVNAAAVKVLEPSVMTLSVTNPDPNGQVVTFRLIYPEGAIGYSAFDFSGACKTYQLSAGGTSFETKLWIPGNTVAQPCEFVLRKWYATASEANRVTADLLDQIELASDLPVVRVTKE